LKKKFWGGGTAPAPLLALSALELGVPRVLFLGNDPCTAATYFDALLYYRPYREPTVVLL